MRLPSIEELEEASRRYPVDPEDMKAALSRVPPSWHQVIVVPDGGAAFRRGSIQVLMSVGRYDDSTGPWLHVSLCGRTGPARFHLPDWEDVKRVKQDFYGDRWAYVVLPPASQYVNQNPHVLHLFGALDGRAMLPDFTRGLGIL